MKNSLNFIHKLVSRIKEKLFVCVIFAIVMVFFLIFKPQCPFITLFGIPCPGCGMTRAYINLVKLNVAGAFEMHPMFWSVPILALYYFFDGNLFSNKIINRLLLFSLSGGFIVCWIFKLIK